ncbi:MAG TPA: hypothetical protein VIA06_24975 [Candidatus Dormibacteraeota bacterium]|nr:hypothetical protein [Candidatus Dormibacteraeota bacterium]
MGGDTGWDDRLLTTIRSARELLSRELGIEAYLELETIFRGDGAEAVVLRCRVTGGPRGAPRTVIVKAFPGDHGEEASSSARARLVNEWSGAVFVQSRRKGLVPTCYGGDADAGVVLFEDLGDSVCLADMLQDDDPRRAEEGLLTYATTLARLHAATAGGHEAYEELRGALAGASAEVEGIVYGERLREYLPGIRDACDTLGIRFPSRLETETDQIVRHLHEPGPFFAFSLGDICPDNHRFVPVPEGEPAKIQFFDLESGGYRNAMLDAAYMLLPFPTCWCVNRLPDDLPNRLESAYRATLVEEGLIAAEGEAFGRALSEAMVAWFIATTHWSLTEALRERVHWGTSSHRQRLPLRAENTARICRRHRHMRLWADLAEQLADELRKRWGKEAQMPLYPAFSGTKQ